MAADPNYPARVHKRQDGNLYVPSGAKVIIESGGQIDASGAGASGLLLPTNQQLGYINFPLTAMRLVASNDMAAKNAADGGLISLDTDPTLKRVNAATDKQLRLAWAANSVIEIICGSFVYPANLDNTQPLVIHLLAGMAGATDVPVLTVNYWEGVGDTNAGGASAALAATVADKTVTIAAVDLGAPPKVATFGITPGAHTTDAIYLYGVWLTYTKLS